MKIITKGILVFALFFQAYFLYSDDLSLDIYYLNGEKSKDSHSSDETFALSGYSMSYSVKYHGRKGKNQHDTVKECTFTEQNIKNIIATIEKKSLNVNDSLFTDESKSKSFESYCNIHLKIVLNGSEYHIKINGDTESLDDNDLYKNSVYFITLLRKMAQDC